MIKHDGFLFILWEIQCTDNVYYTYDASDNLVSMNLNGVEYYYIRNAQGDIIGLFDKDGTQVVSYSYDSWGKLISIDGTLKDTVGVKNPYRYRGYRYDTETGLYYLNSRYYNPEWGRFINADEILGKTGELLSHNVFAYCANNPVVRTDEDGDCWNIIIGAAVGAGCSIASQLLEGTSIDHLNWKDVGISAAAGALSAIPGVGLLGSALISGSASAASDIASGDRSINKIGESFGGGFVVGLGTGAFGEAISRVADKEAVGELANLSKTKIKARIRETGIKLPKGMSINDCKSLKGYSSIPKLGATLLGSNRRTFVNSFYSGLASMAHTSLHSAGIMFF